MGKNKKKLKKRIGGAGIGATGNSQTVANILATVRNASLEVQHPVSAPIANFTNTVNNNHVNESSTNSEQDDDNEEWTGDEDENQFDAANGSHVSTTAVNNQFNDDNDSDEEDEDENSEDELKELKSETVIDNEPATSIFPNKENSVQPHETVTQLETATQENQNMNVVNHPNVTAIAPTAPINVQPTSDTNIVPESAMEQMQRDALTAPPVPQQVAPVESVIFSPAPVEKKVVKAFHKLTVTAMFTLSLDKVEYMTGLKNKLQRVSIHGQEFNLYSPFRKASKKTEKPQAEGIVRYMLSNMLDLTDAINDSTIMVIGSKDQVEEHLHSAVDVLRRQITNLLPATPETTVVKVSDEERQQTLEMQMMDFVNIHSWINSSSEEPEEDKVIAIHNAVINVVINAGMLYDSAERMNYISQIENVFSLVLEKRESTNTDIALAVNMPSYLLSVAEIREFLDQMLQENEGYSLLTRTKIISDIGETQLLPQNKEEIDGKLLSGDADLLLINLLTAESEDADEAISETDAAAESSDDSDE